MKFHERMRSLRKQKGVTLEQAAKDLGYKGYQTIQQWEISSGTGPKRTKQAEVAAYYNTTIEFMMDGVEVKEPATESNFKETQASYSPEYNVLSNKINKLPKARQKIAIKAISQFLDLPQEIQDMLAQNISNFYDSHPVTHKEDKTDITQNSYNISKPNK